MPAARYILPLHRINKHDLELVGHRASVLGELVQSGVSVPDGFVITTAAFHEVMRPKGRADGQLDWQIHPRFSNEFIQEVIDAYEALGSQASVAVRVSPIFSDTVRIGNQLDPDDFLGIQGENNLLEVIKKVWTVFQEAADHMLRFTTKAPPGTPACALLIHRMVPSISSGLVFSHHPVTGNKSQAVIEAVWGLDEELNGEFMKPMRMVLDRGTRMILERQEVLQKEQLSLRRGRSAVTSLSNDLLRKQPLDDELAFQILDVATLVQRELFYPQEIEWAWDGKKLWVLESRKLESSSINSGLIGTSQGNDEHSRASASSSASREAMESFSVLLSAQPASPGLVTGPARIVHNPQDAEALKTGEIMICSMTSAALFPAMKRASAVITEQGGLGTHAAVVCRTLGLPSVMFAYKAKETVKNGEIITVNGSTGQVLRGGFIATSTSYHSDLNNLSKASSSRNEPSTAGKRQLERSAQSSATEHDLLTSTHVHPSRLSYGRWSMDHALVRLGMHYRELERRDGLKLLSSKIVEELEGKLAHVSTQSLLFELCSLTSTQLRDLTYGRELEPLEENPRLGYWGAVRQIADRSLLEVEHQVYRAVQARFRSVEHGIICPGVKTVQGAVSMPRLLERENMRGSIWIRPGSIGVLHQADRFSSFGYHGIWLDLDELLNAFVAFELDQSETTMPADYYEPGFMDHIRAVLHAQRSTRMKIVVASRYELPDQVLKEYSARVTKVRTESQTQR